MSGQTHRKRDDSVLVSTTEHPVPVVHKRQNTLRDNGVYHWTWSYVHLLKHDAASGGGAGGDPLSIHEVDVLDDAFRTEAGPANDVLMSTHLHILTTNAVNDGMRRIQGVDAMYTGLHGQFRIPSISTNTRRIWSERLQLILREKKEFFVFVYNNDDDGTIHTLSRGVVRSREVMCSTHQYQNPKLVPPIYSIRIIFDTEGMVVEFRRDINTIYLALKLVSDLVNWELSTNDPTYNVKYAVVSDPVVVMATCMLLKNNIRYPQCTPNELFSAHCVSTTFTYPAGGDRHSVVAMLVSAAAASFLGGTHLSVARPAYTKDYGHKFPRYNSETYDVDRFDRRTSTKSIQKILSIDRRDNRGERLVVYTSLYNHSHIRTMIGRDYLPSYDVLARHFVYNGPCQPVFKQVHYHTMGIEAWVFQGRGRDDDWVINMSMNTSRFSVNAMYSSMQNSGWSRA